MSLLGITLLAGCANGGYKQRAANQHVKNHMTHSFFDNLIGGDIADYHRRVAEQEAREAESNRSGLEICGWNDDGDGKVEHGETFPLNGNPVYLDRTGLYIDHLGKGDSRYVVKNEAGEVISDRTYKAIGIPKGFRGLKSGRYEIIASKPGKKTYHGFVDVVSSD